jgi:broad-specificity NMP kinase
MPKEIIQGNFQDQVLWRTFNYEIIKNIHSKYNGHIIIPMTLYDKNYYEEIIGKLLKENIKIDHYILGASKETILKRLTKRHERKDSWAAKQIDMCINGFNELREKSIYIDTNELNINEVVETIAKRSNVKLKEDNGIEIIKRIKRTIVQIKHIRLFV